MEQQPSAVKSANNGSTKMDTHLHRTAELYQQRKDHLSAQYGCVLLGSRVVVPGASRTRQSDQRTPPRPSRNHSRMNDLPGPEVLCGGQAWTNSRRKG